MRPLAIPLVFLVTACGAATRPEEVPVDLLPPPVPGWEQRERQAVMGRGEEMVDRQGRPIEVLLARGNAERGRELFRFHCARCHGVDGRGGGPEARRLAFPPRDLSGPRLERKSGAWLYQLLLYGGARLALSAEMPAFAARLSDPDIASIIAFLDRLRHSGADSADGS